jgi:hypothetical protein
MGNWLISLENWLISLKNWPNSVENWLTPCKINWLPGKLVASVENCCLIGKLAVLL